MALTSPLFVVFALLVVFAFHASASYEYRRSVLTFASLLFLASFLDSAVQALPLLAFLWVGWCGMRWMRPGQPVRSVMWIGVVVLMFAELKRYAFLGPLPTLPFPYLLVGLSYVLFRVLQLMIDRSTDPDAPLLTVRQYFDYTCNFLSFVSGPIQRSGQFLDGQQMLARPVDSEIAFRAFARVVLGYLKVAVVSASADFVFQNASQYLFGSLATSDTIRTDGYYLVAAVSYTVYLYYNFAGYMDIVIGIGWLLGQDLPENFDHPFRARNLFEFWSRWHMTLSEWFKTYLFNPLLGLFASHISNAKALPALGVLSFFVTFFVMGVWHGSTLVFVLYGVVMGAGVSLNKVWQIVLTRRMGKKPYRALGESLLYASLARGITTAFFTIAVTALWVDWMQLGLLARKLGFTGLALSFVALAAASALILPAGDALSRAAVFVSSRITGSTRAAFPRQFGLAAEVLFILAVTSFFHKAPEFVYKAF